MDGDVSRWVLEFLLRSSVPDSLIKKIITVLPLSDGDSRLKKTLLLRTLQSQVSKASLTETALEILEVVEELDRSDAVPVTDAMKQAYCAVAVECTVKYLAACPDDTGGEYFDAVKRIWRGRVGKMEAATSGKGSDLFSGELTRWRDEIEAALWDSRICQKLANINSRRDALIKMKGYLKEAWEIMGPSFLDSVATLSKVKGLQSAGANLDGDERGDGPDGPSEGRHTGICEFAFAAEPISKHDGRLEGSANTTRDFVVGETGRIESDDPPCCMGEGPVTDENLDNEQLENRVVTSHDESQGLGDLPRQGDKAIEKGNLLPKRKHCALRRCHRGVKISGADEVDPAKPWNKYDPVPSPEVKKVRESLKSSSLELRALVKDPLPDALHASEVVRSQLANKDINHEPPVENQSGDVDAPDPDVCKSIVLFQPNDANLGKKSSVHCSNVHRPNLMERQSTAHTYEWDESIDNLPHGTQPKRRKRKWTSLEEDTLRAGVKMFGEGNWAAIRNFYSNIFEKRSGVDLKDKWRNMIR